MAGFLFVVVFFAAVLVFALLLLSARLIRLSELFIDLEEALVHIQELQKQFAQDQHHSKLLSDLYAYIQTQHSNFRKHDTHVI